MPWRLINFSPVNQMLNVAVDEVFLLGRHEGFSSETLRLWSPSACIILLPRDANLDYINLEACKRFNVTIVRRCSAGDIFFSDPNTLNFSIVLNEREFKIPSNPLEAYKFLYNGVQKTLNKLGLNPNIEYATPMLINGKIISIASQHYYYDNMLFHGVLFVNSDLSLARKVIKGDFSKKITTLKCEIGREILIEEVKNILVSSFEEVLGEKFTVENINQKEKEILNTLFIRKYGSDKWNIKGKSPLTLKDALIEIYIAYPPTSICRSLLSLINETIADLRDRLEVRVWYRGKGRPPGVEITQGLYQASKGSIIPAVIINGKLKFGPKIPSKKDLRKAIEEAISMFEQSSNEE